MRPIPLAVVAPLAIACAVVCGGRAVAQGDGARAAKEELAHVFDRPAGQPIGDEQRARLRAWLAAREGTDLGELGYAVALEQYLNRDVDAAVATLERFFARYPTVEDAAHRSMLGRVYLNAVHTEGRKDQPEAGRLAAYGERMAKLYDDPTMIVRVVEAVSRRLDDPLPLRLGVARGALASAMAPTQQAELLGALFAANAGATTAAAPARAAASQREPAPGLAVGEPVPAFDVTHTLNGSGFDLAALRGKVVVLDFFATWCPPCRASVPSLVELQRSAGDDVQVVGVTRFYGRGMDFSAAEATAPHGGKNVTDLDQAAELAVNEAFLRRFDVHYPLVFTGEATAKTFGVTAIPTLFVVGKDGRLVGKVVGGGEAAHEQLAEFLAKARGR